MYTIIMQHDYDFGYDLTDKPTTIKNLEKQLRATKIAEWPHFLVIKTNRNPKDKEVENIIILNCNVAYYYDDESFVLNEIRTDITEYNLINSSSYRIGYNKALDEVNYVINKKYPINKLDIL